MALTPVPSLQDIAFYTITFRVWKTTNLPEILIENSDRNQKRRYDFIEKVNDMRQKALMQMQEKVMDIPGLPLFWKRKMAVCLRGIDQEMNDWADELISYLENGSPENVAICCNNISVNQHGFVDKKGTVLRILRDGEFNIITNKHALAHYCVTKDAVREVADKLIADKRDVFNERDVERIYTFVSKVFDVEKYWITVWITSLDIDGKFWNTSLFQFISATKNLQAIKNLFHVMNEEEKKGEIVSAVKFIVMHKFYCPEVLIFFHGFLDEECWLEILERNFSSIFQTLISSWRHRHILVTFFNSIKHTLNVKDFNSIFEMCGASWPRGIYEYQDVVNNIILRIWEFSPAHLREAPSIAYNTIPNLLNLYDDLESLPYFLSYYDIDMRKRVLGHIILYWFGMQKENLIPESVKKVVDNKVLDVENYRDLLDETVVKMYIIHSLHVNVERAMRIDKMIAEYAFPESERLEHFKENLFDDREFVLALGHNISCDWTCGCMLVDLLLNWCCDGDSEKINKIKEKVVKQKWIHEVFSNLLLNTDKLHTSNICFKLFDLPNIQEVKQDILDAPGFKRRLFNAMMRYNTYILMQKYNAYLFEDAAITKQFISEYLFSEEGMETMIDFIKYIPNAESEISVRFLLPNHMIEYLKFKEVWLDPYNLASELDAKLEEYGHPNLRNRTLFVQNRYVAKQHEQEKVKMYIDANYRIFRSIIRLNFTRTYLFHYSQEDNVTAVSQDLAESSGLRVPVVF